jgi:hypothetical protein
MKVYIAAAFCRKSEMAQVANELADLGVEVTSRWLVEQEFDPTRRDKAEFLATRAQIDLDDIDRSDILVRFSDDLSSPTVPSHLATGSRMGETLWALAHNKTVIIVGGYQCVFDYLPQVVHVKNADVLKYTLIAVGGQ